ncbi:MAG: PEP-CTERM sorting domain-containing protein [Gammaproteobacteria bacterium]|nr:PEP-CTERM sorting domain-containing protein [Gammaproteobacteria bacterium]MCB1924303.1 PEP-CTERM sorting domain-containing protein [Gammaproteobacteria bacterium]
MKLRNQHFLAAAVGLVLAQASGTASAEVTWTFDSANCVSTLAAGHCSGGDSHFSSYRTYQGVGTDAVDVTVSGWANTSNGTAGTNTALGLGMITHYSGGLGVKNADAGAGGDTYEGNVPEHAIDNNDRYDLVLFDFGAGNSVSLNDIQIGWTWSSGDADINLLAYTGAGAMSLSGVEFHTGGEGLTAAGWSLVGNYDLNPNQSSGVNAGDVSSRYWIVAAHNNILGTDCEYDSNGCPNANDYFKVLSMSGTFDTPTPPGSVPSPAPLALIGLGLAAIATRRKRH